MASIFTRPDSKFWFAAYRAADGRRVKVATKTEDEEEAQRLADRLELGAREGLAKRAAVASLVGVNDAMQRATQLAVAGRLDAHAARDLVNDLLVAVGEEALDTVTNRNWCDTWRASKAGAVKERSKLKYEQVSREWLEFLGGKGNKPLEAVARADAIAYRDRLAKEGLSARTVNQTVKLLRSVYSEAVEQGHLGRNPFAGVDRLREQVEDAGRKMPFTIDDVAALIKTAEGEWKGLAILAATTGLRLLDGARLKWANLNLSDGFIRVKTSKRDVTLTLPIHSAFAKWLSKQTQGIAAAPVFPTLANKAGPGKSGLSMTFKRLMQRAGVEAGVARTAQEKGRGRTTSKKSYHSFRHFASTQLASNGVRDDIARSITGHADAVTRSNYVTAAVEVASYNAIKLPAYYDLKARAVATRRKVAARPGAQYAWKGSLYLLDDEAVLIWPDWLDLCLELPQTAKENVAGYKAVCGAIAKEFFGDPGNKLAEELLESLIGSSGKSRARARLEAIRSIISAVGRVAGESS